MLDFKNQKETWEILEIDNEISIRNRYNLAAGVFSDSIYIFGGLNITDRHKTEAKFEKDKFKTLHFNPVNFKLTSANDTH